MAVLTAAVLAAACSDPPTSGGDGAVAAGDDEGAALPDCPLDALESADGPVEVTLWYGGLNGSTKVAMDDMVAGFNASQDDVVLNASNQGADYAEVYRKYTERVRGRHRPAARHDLPGGHPAPGHGRQRPGAARPGVHGGRRLRPRPTSSRPCGRSTRSNDVLLPGYMNVSTPVLYYNKAHWQQAGLDPEDPPETLDELYEAAKALKEAGVSDKPFSFKTSRWFFETWLTGIGRRDGQQRRRAQRPRHRGHLRHARGRGPAWSSS